MVWATTADDVLAPAIRQDTSGTEHYRAQVEARFRELGVEPAILRPVADDELPALVAACDVFVLASTKEGLGWPRRALAARRPVVLSDLPVFREVFGGASRFGAAPEGLADALDAPPADPALGAALAASHTWARAAEGHLALYAALAVPT